MKNQKAFMKVKDHSVSGEFFQLNYNEEFDMFETFPQPKKDDLPQYYNTDDYISHTDSKRNVMEYVYHFVRQFTLKRKIRLINNCTKIEKKILDVGCGTGDFLKAAQNNGWVVIGIEPNQEARSIANSKTNNAVFDIDHLSKINDHFDVITLWHVLEHLPDLKTQIENLKRLLNPNGTLIIAVPNFKSYDAKFYKSNWAAYDVPRHLWHFSKKSISKLFQNNGLKVIKHKPMLFDSFYVSLLSEKYKSGKMNPFRALWVGLYSNILGFIKKEYSSHIYILKSS